MTRFPKRIFLVGPSGSGKSSVAVRVADSIGYRAVDIDALISERIDMPIAEFFQRFGEPAFRAIETEILSSAGAGDRIVVATGGGVVLADANWRIMRPESAIVGLSGDPDVLVSRVRSQTQREGSTAARPLLAGDAVAKLRGQLAVRKPFYERADFTVDTSSIDIDQVVAEVIDGVRSVADGARIPALSISTPTERSDIYVSEGAADALPALIDRRWPGTSRIWLLSDDTVFEHWGEQIGGALSTVGEVHVLQVPPGEDSKSFSRVDELLSAMTSAGVTRRDVVVALGGGVVGDLAGFVAAVGLRGLPLVQVPTSLLAMVDSSVGGKTGVNMPAGKNLVGAFYQPGIVVVDPKFLTTLSPAEYRSGMAEVIKHSFIQPSTPLGGQSLRDLLAGAESLNPVPAELLVELLRLNIAIKHSVVEADERESRLRMILNFGHTAGHAIEADGYRYRHGEAVALGMRVALELGRMMGRISSDRIQKHLDLMHRAGLPVRATVDIDAVMGRMAHDKKNVAGRLHWILPCEGDDGVEIVTDVTQAHVRAALEALACDPVSGDLPK